MSRIRFQCYVCNQELEVGADKAGKKAKCIQCQTVLTIPAAPQEEAVGTAPPPPGPKMPPLPGGPSAPPPASSFRDDEPPRRLREDDYDDRDDDYDRPRRRRDDDSDDDRPRGRRRGRDDSDDFDSYPSGRGGKAKKWKSQWPKVRVGLLLSFIGTCLTTGGFAITQIGWVILMIAMFSRGMGGGGAVIWMERIGAIFMTLSLILVIIGQIFWIFISNKQGGLVWAIVSLSVGVVTFVWLLVFRFIPAFRPDAGFLRAFTSAGDALLYMLAYSFLATHQMMSGFYLRAVGATLKDRYIGGKGMTVVIMASVATGYYLILPFIQSALTGGMGALIAGWIFYWIGVICFSLMVVNTLGLMNLGRAVTDV